MSNGDTMTTETTATETRTLVQELREAASTLRQFAENTTRGPWVAHPTITRVDDNEYAWTVCRPLCETEGGPACESDCGRDVLVTGADGCESDYAKQADAHWIALANPLLAGPLAEWLEMEAHMAEKYGLSVEGNTFHALKVARVINGEVR